MVYDRGDLRVFVDGRLQLATEVDLPAGSPIAVFGEVSVGYCALTRSTPAIADREAPRPIAPSATGVEATVTDEVASGTGKRLLGEDTWGDFVLTATVSFALDAPGAHADLLLRASQLSEGGEGDDTVLGINFLLGYSIQLHHDRVLLARHAYDQRILAERELPLDRTRPHALRVRAHEGSFTVEVDGDEVLNAEDPHPYPVGRIGIRTVDSELRVESLTIAQA